MTNEIEKREPDVTYRSLCMVCGVFVQMKTTTAKTAPAGGEMRDSWCAQHDPFKKPKTSGQ